MQRSLSFPSGVVNGQPFDLGERGEVASDVYYLSDRAPNVYTQNGAGFRPTDFPDYFRANPQMVIQYIATNGNITFLRPNPAPSTSFVPLNPPSRARCTRIAQQLSERAAAVVAVPSTASTP